MCARVEPRLQSPLRLHDLHRDTSFYLETNCNRSNFTTTLTTPLIRICIEVHPFFFYELRKWIQPSVCRHCLHLSLSKSVSYITRGDARDGVYWVSKSVRICTVITGRRLPLAENRPQKRGRNIVGSIYVVDLLGSRCVEFVFRSLNTTRRSIKVLHLSDILNNVWVL